MADLTYKVNVDVANAVTALGGLEKKILGLKSAVAGIGLLAFTRNAFMAADAMSDLSNATGIAIGQIISLQYAMEAAGGRIDQVDSSIVRFSLSIDEAAQGSAKLQSTFAELGISLEELGSLSQEQLLQEVAKGFATIDLKGREAAIANEIFGKSIRGVDIKKYAEEILKTQGQYDTYGRAVEKAAELQGRLDRALLDVRLAFLEVVEPVVSLTEFIKSSETGVKLFTIAIKTLTVALSVLAGGAILRGLVGILGTLGRGVTAFKNLRAASASAKSVTKLGDDLTKTSQKGTEAATKLADKWGQNSQLMKALRAGAMLLGGAIGGIATGAAALLGGGESTDAAKPAEEAAKREVKAQREVIDALKEKVATIRQVGQAYADSNREVINNITNEAKYLQMSDNEAEVQKALDDLYQRTAKTIQDLQNQKAKLTEKQIEEKKAIDETIAAINNQARSDAERTVTALQNLQKEREAIGARNRALQFGETIRQDTASLEAMKAEIDMLYMSSEQREEYKRKLDNEIALKQRLAAIDLEAAQAGKNATQTQIDDWNRRRAAAIDYYTKLDELQQQEKTVREDQARQIKVWGEDTKKALEDSINPANQVKNFWDGLSTQIDSFAKTGKFKVKEFLASIIQDFIAAKLKLAALDFLKVIGLGGGGGLLGGSIIPGFLAEGGPATAGKPYIVGEEGPELFVPKASGTVVPNNQLGGKKGSQGNMENAQVNNTYITNNITAMDAKSVAQVFAENRKTLLGSVIMAQKEMPYATNMV